MICAFKKIEKSLKSKINMEQEKFNREREDKKGHDYDSTNFGDPNKLKKNHFLINITTILFYCALCIIDVTGIV